MKKEGSNVGRLVKASWIHVNNAKLMVMHLTEYTLFFMYSCVNFTILTSKHAFPHKHLLAESRY